MNKIPKLLFEYPINSIFRISAIAIFLTHISVFAGSANKVATSANEVCPIKVGDKIADITLIDKGSKKINLGKILAKQPTVLIIYRGSWCPYCNVHLGELQTIESKLINLGYQIVGISPDLPQYL